MLAKKYSIHIISGVSVRRYVPLLLSSRCACISSTGGWRLYFAGWVQFLGDVPHWEKFSRLYLRLAALTWALGKRKPGFNGTVTMVLERRFSRTLARHLKFISFARVVFEGLNLVSEGIALELCSSSLVAILSVDFSEKRQVPISSTVLAVISSLT